MSNHSQSNLFDQVSDTPHSDAERAEEIRRLIAFHDHQYYVLDAPMVTDNEYDGLFRELHKCGQ